MSTVMPKQKSPHKPTASNDNRDTGQRGEVSRGGNKIHGDDLEGAIPTTPMTIDRPRDERVSDNEGPPK